MCLEKVAIRHNTNEIAQDFELIINEMSHAKLFTDRRLFIPFKAKIHMVRLDTSSFVKVMMTQPVQCFLLSLWAALGNDIDSAAKTLLHEKAQGFKDTFNRSRR